MHSARFTQEKLQPSYPSLDVFFFFANLWDSDVEDPLPSVLPPPTTDKKALLRHLEKTSPEALALARDWEDTVHSLETTKQKIAE